MDRVDGPESAADNASFEPDRSDADLRRARFEEEVLSRQREGDQLIGQARSLLAKTDQLNNRRQVEQDARAALTVYPASLDWAEGTDMEDEAHRRLDEAGRWVREAFGCVLDRSGEAYKQTCPVALGHNRIGLSVGGCAASRACSLCGQDVSECEHLPGTAYMVPGGADDLGWCRVCCKQQCEHVPTEMYRASLVSIIRELKIDEVSLVSKPAQPEARIHAVSIPWSDLRAVLGDAFTPG